METITYKTSVYTLELPVKFLALRKIWVSGTLSRVENSELSGKVFVKDNNQGSLLQRPFSTARKENENLQVFFNIVYWFCSVHSMEDGGALNAA